MTRLPAEPDAFIGRGQEMAELRGLLATERMLTLCAACGMGKSRLAIRLAHEVAGDFSDGAVLIKLADLDLPELLVSHVAEQLGIVEERGRDLLDTLVDALRGSRLLLVLDNCEHLVDIVAAVSVRLLADCPGLRILATSREPLHVTGESVRRIPALTVPPAGEVPARAQAYDAVRLFAVRAAAWRPEFRLTAANIPDVVRICRALDGMPLAIELAAARVPALSPAEIADRLDDRFRLLTAGDRTAPARLRSLQAAVDWSHDLLSEHERILFRRLSIFAEGWTLEAAESVCAGEDLPRSRVLDVVTALVDKSLVVCVQRTDEETRYGLLQTIRDYAGERLDEADERHPVGRRHRDWYRRECERRMWIVCGPEAGESLPDPFTPTERDYANILVALNWSLEQGEAEPGLRLSVSVAVFWLPGGRLAEANAWLNRFLAIPGAPVSDGVRGRALSYRARFSEELGDAGAATRDGLAALHLCREADDRLGAAAALYVLGMARFRREDFAEARAYFAEGVEAALAARDTWQAALLYAALGAVATRQQDWEDAERQYKDAVALGERHRMPLVRAQALSGMGILAQRRGDLSLARQRLEESLPILREHANRNEFGRCLVALARIAIARRDAPAAWRYIAEVLPVCRVSGQRLALARGLEAAAEVARLERDHRRTVLLAGAAVQLRYALGGSPARARFQALIRDARRGLGAEETDRLWEAGRDLGPDGAIELALGPTPPAVSPGPLGPRGSSRPRSPGASPGRPEGAPLVGDPRPAHPEVQADANQTGGVTPTSSARSSPGSRSKRDGPEG